MSDSDTDVAPHTTPVAPIQERFRYVVVHLRGTYMWFNASKDFGYGVEDRVERRIVREGLKREEARRLVGELNDV